MVCGAELDLGDQTIGSFKRGVVDSRLKEGRILGVFPWWVFEVARDLERWKSGPVRAENAGIRTPSRAMNGTRDTRVRLHGVVGVAER